MTICSKCNTEYEGKFCPNCGATEDPSARQQSMPDQRWSGVGVYPQYVDETHITTSLEWFGWILLQFFLPVIGIIIMLCCAPGKSAKNYAKTWLVLYIVIVGLAIAGVILAILVPSTLGFLRNH